MAKSKANRSSCLSLIDEVRDIEWNLREDHPLPVGQRRASVDPMLPLLKKLESIYDRGIRTPSRGAEAMILALTMVQDLVDRTVNLKTADRRRLFEPLRALSAELADALEGSKPSPFLTGRTMGGSRAERLRNRCWLALEYQYALGHGERSLQAVYAAARNAAREVGWLSSPSAGRGFTMKTLERLRRRRHTAWCKWFRSEGAEDALASYLLGAPDAPAESLFKERLDLEVLRFHWTDAEASERSRDRFGYIIERKAAALLKSVRVEDIDRPLPDYTEVLDALSHDGAVDSKEYLNSAAAVRWRSIG